MIVESIFNMLFSALDVLFALLPTVEWNVQSSFFTAFLDVLSVACYFLPMGTVTTILELIVIINTFKIFVSLIKTVWQLIPFL